MDNWSFCEFLIESFDKLKIYLFQFQIANQCKKDKENYLNTPPLPYKSIRISNYCDALIICHFEFGYYDNGEKLLLLWYSNCGKKVY